MKITFFWFFSLKIFFLFRICDKNQGWKSAEPGWKNGADVEVDREMKKGMYCDSSLDCIYGEVCSNQ